MVESAGGVAVPLDDASGGGVVDGVLLESGVLDIVLELDVESAGAAGAVADVSVLGEVEFCFAQATRANALRHIKTGRLRFIRSPLYGSSFAGADRVPAGHLMWSQEPFQGRVIERG